MKDTRCGFCRRVLHPIEDFLTADGIAFHPQATDGHNVRCSRRERKFEELNPIPYVPILSAKKKKTAVKEED